MTLAGTDVCLVLPPFSSVHFPHLGSAVLKGACQARGLKTRIVYGNLLLAAHTGLDAYDAVCATPMGLMLGERLFRTYAYPPETVARLSATIEVTPELQAIVDAVAPSIGPALDETVEQVLQLRPRIVGVSSTFQQNLACAAVALRVKQAAPEIRVVMGGANAAWPICNGLAEAFPWIDHFFAGESDIDFPDFCVALQRGESTGQRVVSSNPIRDMRTVHPPDFSDFFEALRPLQIAGRLPDWLPRFLTMETSRGCWWGAKQHCTFCGLNGDGMDFRDKPPATVLDELEALDAWGVEKVHMTDNIMPHHYLTDVMPALAARGAPWKLYYEVKSNLNETQIDTLRYAGVVAIQPGIESFSSEILKLMRKGVSAHQNIALLRSCAGAGVQAQWGLLYGFPGERAAEYEATIALMPRLAHLEPPNAAHRILIDRYSPYYRTPEELGIHEVTPGAHYRALYPPEVPAADVAYHFDGAYSTELLDRPELLARLNAAIADWHKAWSEGRSQLQLLTLRETGVVLDTRPIARAPMTPLTAGQHAALLRLERPVDRAAIAAEMADDAGWLIDRDFVIDHEGKLLSLVVRPRAASVLPAGKHVMEVAT